MTTTPEQAVIQAAFRAGFRAATRYDWNYSAEGMEAELEEAAVVAYLQAQPLPEPQRLGKEGEALAVIRYRRGETGHENEMPQVISCNWLPDGEYPVFLRSTPAQAEPVAWPDDPDELAGLLSRIEHITYDAGSDATTMLKALKEVRDLLPNDQIAEARKEIEDGARPKKGRFKL